MSTENTPARNVHDPESWTIEDMVRVCHRAGLRVNFMAMPPEGYERRVRPSHRWRMTPTRLSLIQRGFHAKPPLPMAVTPFASWSRDIQSGMKLRRLRALGVRR